MHQACSPNTPSPVKQDEKCLLCSFFGGWRRKKRTKKNARARGEPFSTPVWKTATFALVGSAPYPANF